LHSETLGLPKGHDRPASGSCLAPPPRAMVETHRLLSLQKHDGFRFALPICLWTECHRIFERADRFPDASDRVECRRPLKRDMPKAPSGANEQDWCHRQACSLKTPTLFSVRTTIHIPRNARAASAAARCCKFGRNTMTKIDRRSALGIGLAAASAAMVKS